MCAIPLCCAISQFESFKRFANFATFFCTRSNTFIRLSLNGSQHAAPHSRIGRPYWSVAKRFVLLLPILRIHILKWSAFWLLSLCNKHDQTSLNHCTGLFPSIYNCSLPELLGPVVNKFSGSFNQVLVKLLALLLQDLISFYFPPPTPPVCPDLQLLYVIIFHYSPTYHMLVCKQTDSLLNVLPNIIYIS